jgi:hypothetical protein
LLRQLGISDHELVSSFGITDVEELRKRCKLVSFLIENPKLMDAFSKSPCYHDYTLPDTGNQFLSFYFHERKNERMPLYKNLRKLRESLSKISTSSCNEMDLFKKFLDENLDIMQKEELAKAKLLKERIDQATFLQGTINLKIEKSFSSESLEISLKSDAAYGYRKNYYGLANNILLDIPDWVNLDFWKYCFWIGPFVKKTVVLINKLRTKKYYSSYLYDSMPPYIFEDLKSFLKDKFLLVPKDTPEKPKNKMYDFLKRNKINGLYLDYFFTYDERGLFVKLVDVGSLGYDSEVNNFVNSVQFDDEQKNFVGYSLSTRDKISKKNYENLEVIKNRFKSRNSLKLISLLNRIFPKMEEGVIIESPKSDLLIKWHRLSHLYTLPEMEGVFNDANTFRQYIKKQLIDLHSVSTLINGLQKKAKGWNIKLTVPQILNQEDNLIAFSSLYPIQIIGDKGSREKVLSAKDIREIKSLAHINGQLVGLTGQNAGGKSVTHETVINALYLAQSGLPIFGENFKCNPKKLIGMLFLERGEGSTMQLQARGMKKIFDALNKHKENSSFLVLDEIGTGTDYYEALSYGIKLLKAIANRKVSCLYTTQFSDIAKEAEKIGAINFQIDKDHSITKGVGRPNLDHVLQEEGLDKYLN